MSRGSPEVWKGHADDSMSALYDKIKENEKFRRDWAEKCGIGFELPSVVPNVPKTEGNDEVVKTALFIDCR